MIQVDLQQQGFRQINLVMNLSENRQLEVENAFGLQVDYAEDNAACMAQLHQAVRDKLKPEEFSIELIGLCTDICVVSNALLLKAHFPEAPISVDASCCAGVTPEKHAAALTTLRSCQVQVENG